MEEKLHSNIFRTRHSAAGQQYSGAGALSFLDHYHGQIWNAAEPARSLGINESTVRRYLDLLDSVFMVRQLPPWHENLKKRQVKSPKIYFRDSGLLHQLLGIRGTGDLLTHPKCGASWEGYIVEELLSCIKPDEAFFWVTYAGAEIDLLLFKDGRRIGVEIKRADAPKLTPSMRTAMTDLKLDRLLIFYPGERPYTLAVNVEVIPFSQLADNGGLV
jgi:predicted AAA+ superfamily ATPase